MKLKLPNPDKIIMVGDRVLIKRRKSPEQTRAGLILPPDVEEKEDIQSGYIMRVGPGYPIPVPADEDEKWKQSGETSHYLPLQAREGDLAVFLQKQAFEIEFEKEKYYIVPHTAILLLYRDE